MDITYDKIVKYLSSTNNNNSSNFPNRINLIVYGNDFPETYSNMFGKNYYRYGVNIYDNNQNNISFYSSLLAILDKSFVSTDVSNQILQINNFKLFLLNSLVKKEIDFEFKKQNLTIQTLKNTIRSSIDRIVLQYISDLFNINILILNFNDSTTKIVFHDDYCNPWKPFIILAKKDDNYEPIINEKKKIFSLNDNIIKKILKTDINYLDEEIVNKYYSLVDNFQEIYNTLQIENEINIDEIKLMKKKEIIELILGENSSHKNLNRLRKDKLIDLYINEKKNT